MEARYGIMNKVIGTIMFIIYICCTCSCVPYTPCEAWILVNNFSEEISSVTVYEYDNQILQSPVHPADVGPNSTVQVYTSLYRTIYSELKEHPETRVYFMLNGSGFDFSEIHNIMDYSVAYIDPEPDWLLHKLGIIIFPDDCTVNPDLWKIYDLDAFVEKYGPLKAKGWDEVWQKWEENKRTGEVDTEIAVQ